MGHMGPPVAAGGVGGAPGAAGSSVGLGIMVGGVGGAGGGQLDLEVLRRMMQVGCRLLLLSLFPFLRCGLQSFFFFEVWFTADTSG